MQNVGLSCAGLCYVLHAMQFPVSVSHNFAPVPPANEAAREASGVPSEAVLLREAELSERMMAAISTGSSSVDLRLNLQW